MKRIGKKVAILLAVMALTGGYVHTASMTAQVTAASPEELQKSAWEKLLANNAGALTEEEKNSLNQVFSNISAWDQYIRLSSTYTQVIGGDNHAVDSNSIQGRAVYGGNHQYVSDAAATLGQQGNNFGTNSVVVGYQPSAFGENSIAMGTGATTFPIKYGENFAGYANAIGADAWSGDMGNAFGAGAVAMGKGSVAIGTRAVAGSPDIQKYIRKYEYQPYFEQLQAAYPNIFGETQPNESVTERSERMGQQIFAEYSSYFKKIGIPDFATFKTRVSQWESVLQKLGWHMALSKDARHHVTALGFGATATATGGVALGAFSEADRGTVTEKAPFSEFELTNQNTLGAVSVGNKTFLRQLINVADGTEATDAVNLRQLQALNKKVDGKKDIHFFSANGSDSGINYDNQGARAGYTTAVGLDAMATEENSQAFGYRARAIGHSSIVFGVESTASGARDIAIGYGSHAVGSDNTNTSWNDTIAIGWNALSRGGSFASGTGAVAGGSGSVALGAGAYVGTKWLDDETQKAQNVNKWVLTRSFLDKGLRDELKAKFPEKFAEWKQRAEKMPAAMGSEYLEQKLRTLAMEQLPQMTSPSMKNTMKDMDSSIAIGRRTKVYSASAIAIGSEAKVGENLDGAIALGNQSLATRNAGIFGYDPTSDAKTWTDFKKAHPEAGIGAAREQEIQREMNALSDEVAQMGPTYQAWVDKEKYPDKYLDERKAYAEANGNTLNGNNEWVEWVLHARNEQQKLWNKGQELTNKYNNLQKELNGGANLGKGAWIGNKASLAIGNEEDGVTRQITGVAAGTKDTDAVNVAQLKVLNTKVDKVAANSTAYTVETKENDDNTTTVTIKSNKAGDKGTTVTVATKDIHITSGTYDKNTKKLTFTTNTNTTFDVDMNDVINAAAEGSVHYLSVNSSEQGAGSNYKNDGAKGVHAVAIGAYATADSVGGVSLGRDSTAKREGGLFGYNPKNGAAFVDGTAVAEYLGKTTEYDALQTEMTAKKTAVEEAKAALKDNPTDTTKKEDLNKAYQALEAVQQKENLLLGAYRSASGYGAFSVGNEEKGITRQITGVAAGTKDTDAVNVAQLKVLNTKVDKVAANSTAYTVETKENDDNTTTVTIKSNKAGDKGTTVTVATKDIHITSGTYDKNTKKLTFTTNTNTTFDVDMNDVINAAAEGSVHYLSVNSSEQGAGSNYKNDGAKGVHAVAIGAYATADSVGGVSLGRDSTAKREGGLFGYNPKNGAAFVDGTAVAEYLGKTTEYDALQTEMTAKKTAVEEAKAALKDNPTDTTKKEDLNKAYQALEAVQQKENLLLGAYRSASGYGAFSVGNEEKGITRQITGVAAGTKDTDAVNVAQLKVLNTKVDKVAANSTAYTVETKENDDNTTTVTIKSNKAGDKGTTVTVATKDIHITSGTYDKNTKKLTFTTNTNTTFDVDMNDVINAAAEGSVHYLSVNSSEQGAGSNYKNDGAKAKGSIVLGVRSSSEGINGVVVGNDNKLTGTKNDQNNSVVIGTGLNVDGVHNIVVGTNYENYDQKETKVKGEQNTVIGNGNLVGYTAVKDPHDATKWKYTEVSTSGSDRNVVVGSCNTANVSSVAVGTSLEVEDLGRAFGSGNKIIGSNNGGGQWGLALGSNNTVKGEMAVSVGTETNAFGDWTVAIGSEAKTHATNSIAMGYQAETVKGWSAAIGSESKTTGEASTAVGGLSASATVDYGAAFGSFSVAQRASGVAGYLANGQTGSAWISSLGAFSVGDDVTGYSRQITGVAAGSEDTDAVNVAQLKALEKKLFKVLPEVVGDQNTGVVVEKNPKENTSTPSTGGTTPAPAAENKTVYKVKLDKKIDVGHISIDGTENKETVVVGDVKINGEKGHGTVTGLSNTTWDEKHVVSGRAATEDQLQAVSQKNRQAISELGTQLERGTASAAALAALHPQEFDPADKWDFAVGYSNYRSANTFAFGGFYRPNERTLVSLGGTFGGENIVNVGLSFKTGKGSDGISTSRIAMAREIQVLKEQDAAKARIMQELLQVQKKKEAEIQALKEKDGQREEQIRKLTAMVMELKK